MLSTRISPLSVGDWDGNTPLHYAAARGFFEAVQVNNFTFPISVISFSLSLCNTNFPFTSDHIFSLSFFYCYISMSLVFFSLSPICLLPLSAFFSLYLPSSTSAISISYCFFLSLLNLLFPSHSPESSLSFSLS